jgi:hypothetical protein
LLGVLNDRRVNGIQQFLCNWAGMAKHQWATGKDLECNTALIEYARKTGKRLDWAQLDGSDPAVLQLEGAGVKTRKATRAKLDWERSPKAVSAPKRKALPDERPRKRPLAGGRICKYQ